MSAEIIIMEDIVKDAVQCFKEYAICHEEQVTERKRIVAQMKVINKMIDANKEICLKSLQMAFEERKALYKSVQIVIETATEKGDTEMLKVALDFQGFVYKEKLAIDGQKVSSIEQIKLLDVY